MSRASGHSPPFPTGKWPLSRLIIGSAGGRRYKTWAMSKLLSNTTLQLEGFRAYLALLARSLPGIDANEASDLVQCTLLAACAQKERFRGSSPREQAAWLKQILRNQAIDAHRRQRRLKRDAEREVSLDAIVDGSLARAEAWLAVMDSSPSQRASREEELGRLGQALSLLPDAQREAIVQHHLQGASLTEVARRLGRTQAAVAGLLHRGLKQLRQHLDGEPST
jgi:RNA polymerase sigma-70 factor, ECF subfamily